LGIWGIILRDSKHLINFQKNNKKDNLKKKGNKKIKMVALFAFTCYIDGIQKKIKRKIELREDYYRRKKS
jgi:hypothetical protein